MELLTSSILSTLAFWGSSRHGVAEINWHVMLLTLKLSDAHMGGQLHI